jgi:serine/threonine protein kinase
MNPHIPIIKTPTFEIFDKRNNIFQIQFAHSSPALIRSLIKTRLINNGYTNDTYTIVKFKAHSVKTLHQIQSQSHTNKIRIRDAAKIIHSLASQLSYLLQTERHTILGYSPENIIIINETTPAFLGSEFVAPLAHGTNSAMICCPYSHTDFFFSPEIANITEIPSHIHYKTAYFSFACLIMYLLLGNDDFYNDYMNKIRHPNNLIQVLDNHPIKNTKMYWLLSRCLVEDPNNRTILLI